MEQTPSNTPSRTGYPSVDKPWLKYYSEEAIRAPLPKMTMYAYAFENNREHLADTAFRYFGTKIAYGQFFDRAKQAAQAFWALGVRKGDIVTIMSMHTPETIYALYGLNYIGAAANMVYMTLSEKEILHTLEHTESKLFLVLDPALPRVEKIRDQIKVPVVVLSVADSMPAHLKAGYRLKNKETGKLAKKGRYLSFAQFRSRGAEQPEAAVDSGALAVIVYTSGTTGEPKGVMLSSDNINALAFQFQISDFRFGRGESYLDIIPTFLGYGIGMLVTAVSAGLATTLWIQLNPQIVAKQIEDMKPNHLEIGVAFLDAILKGKYSNMNYLVNFASGGGAITVEKEREINEFLKSHNANTHLIMGYGMTEFASSVCNNLHHATKEGSVGVPFPKANAKIIDSISGRELPYREMGEICINAPNMMMGYYRCKQETDEVIKKDEKNVRWLYTGDVGYIDEDGFIFVKGRTKRLSYIRMSDGTVMRLFPQRIEELFAGDPAVSACGVIVREDEVRLNIPIAFVTLKDPNVDSAQAVTALCALAERELPEHMRPEEILILDKMPLTASGKIDYRELEKIIQNQTRRDSKGR